ncbi:MAG: hypothetical protein AAGF11_30845 [Myxococcota bacterium]
MCQILLGWVGFITEYVFDHGIAPWSRRGPLRARFSPDSSQASSPVFSPESSSLSTDRSPVMSIDSVLREAQRTIPECIASGVIDLNSGMLLAVKTVDSHPQEVLDMLAAATGDLFQGDNVVSIERTFKRIRGVSDDDHHYFQEIVIFSDNLLHVFQRCKRRTDTIFVTVCRKKANVGMVLVRARGLIDSIERSI